MSYAPPTLREARDYLISRGMPAAGVGIVGDTAHGNEGYHVGWDRLQSGYGRGDYSVAESSRDARPTDAAMALDIGEFPRLRELSGWIALQCETGAADTRDIREIIYSPDGKTVRRWDRLRQRSGGDNSHLWHTHISYFRDSERNDKVALFRRFFEQGKGVKVGVELTDKVAGTPDHPTRTLAEVLTDIWHRTMWDLPAVAKELKKVREENAVLRRELAEIKARPSASIDTGALADALGPVLVSRLGPGLMSELRDRLEE